VADDFVIVVIDRRFDEVYQLATDMGGAGYIFTGEHGTDIMHNSVIINLNVADAAHKRNIKRVFYSLLAYRPFHSLSRDRYRRARDNRMGNIKREQEVMMVK
jgi:GDP-D-mannose 3',5'-epimerase